MSRQYCIQEIVESLGSINRVFNVRGQYPFMKNKLGKPHLEVLFILSSNDQKTIKQIAQQLNITSGATTQIIDKLVEQGLVAKSHDESDKRSRNIQLSKMAKKEIDKFKQNYIKSISDKFSDLNIEDIKNLNRLLKKVKNKNV